MPTTPNLEALLPDLETRLIILTVSNEQHLPVATRDEDARKTNRRAIERVAEAVPRTRPEIFRRPSRAHVGMAEPRVIDQVP